MATAVGGTVSVIPMTALGQKTYRHPPTPISPLLSLTLWRTAREALQSHPGHHYYPKQPRIYVSVLERNKYSASGDIRHFKSLPRETLCSVRVVPWNKVNTETQPVTQTGGHYTK